MQTEIVNIGQIGCDYWGLYFSRAVMKMSGACLCATAETSEPSGSFIVTTFPHAKSKASFLPLLHNSESNIMTDVTREHVREHVLA